MGIEWSQVVPTGTVFFGLGLVFRYLFTRWVEKKHLDEQLARGDKAVKLANELLELHKKACDRNANISLPLGKDVIRLMPVTPEEEAEELEYQHNLLGTAQNSLLTMLEGCLDLVNIRNGQATVEDVMQHSVDNFVRAYEEFDAQNLMRDYSVVEVTQVLHNFYAWVTQGGEANAEAFAEAREKCYAKLMSLRLGGVEYERLE